MDRFTLLLSYLYCTFFYNTFVQFCFQHKNNGHRIKGIVTGGENWGVWVNNCYHSIISLVSIGRYEVTRFSYIRRYLRDPLICILTVHNENNIIQFNISICIILCCRVQKSLFKSHNFFKNYRNENVIKARWVWIGPNWKPFILFM